MLELRFEWDEPKSGANLRERGFDFAFASLVFDGPTLEGEDRRADYGERRVVAIGLADDVCLTVVYTDRQGAAGETIRRVISARRSSRHERKVYKARNSDVDPAKPGSGGSPSSPADDRD